METETMTVLHPRNVRLNGDTYDYFMSGTEIINVWLTGGGDRIKPVAIVDIDGVLYNWYESFNNILIGVIDRHRAPWLHAARDVKRIDWTERHSYVQQMTSEEYAHFHDEFDAEIYGSMMQMEPGLRWEMERLNQMCAVAFVTARPETVKIETVEFLDWIMSGEPYLLHFATDKSIVGELCPRFAIDDTPKHVEEFLTIDSIEVAALRRGTYNRDLNGTALVASNDRVASVEYFGGFVDIIEDVLSAESATFDRDSVPMFNFPEPEMEASSILRVIDDFGPEVDIRNAIRPHLRRSQTFTDIVIGVREIVMSEDNSSATITSRVDRETAMEVMLHATELNW